MVFTVSIIIQIIVKRITFGRNDLLTYTGLPLIFSKFCQVFKNTHFGSIFGSLRLKTVLNSTKTLERYCKANLNMFFK